MSESGKIRWYFDRLRAMGARELALRVREKVRQRFDVLTVPRIVSRDLSCGSASAFPVLPDRTLLPARLRDGIRTESEQILAGKWQILDGTVLTVDLPPDWHRDYIGGGACRRLAYAHNINHRKLAADCDPRLIWETSRFIQLTRLAQRAWLDQDHDIAVQVLRMLQSWFEHNPLGRGINWTSPMEAGIRLINLVWIDALLADMQPERGEASVVIEKLVAQHVWWTWRNRSFGSSANNHLLGELCGLTMAVARWPELARHSASLETLVGLVWDEVPRQFAADGGNREEALHYHLFAWEMCWQATRAARPSGITPPQPVTERLARAGEYFAVLVAPEEPWDFGDSDNAHVTPVYATQDSALSEWQAWFLGEEQSNEEASEEGNSIAAWLGPAPRAESTGKRLAGWTVFEESGYARYARDRLNARLDLSSLGFAPMAAHGHLDALHLSLWQDDMALVIDPGTGAYFNDPEARSYLASAAAHNAPFFLDECGYPARRGPFLWSGALSRPRLSSLSEEQLSAELVLGDRKVVRQIVFDDNFSMTVVDKLNGSGEFQISWQFSPEMWLLDGGQVGRAELRLHIEVESDAIVEQSWGAGSAVHPGPGFCSPSFRQYAGAPYLVVRGRSAGAARITTKFRIVKS